MADENKVYRDGVAHSAVSDIGMRRSNNQDSFGVTVASDEKHFNTRGNLYIVADGMGAHAAGELASKLAVDGVSHLYHKYRELSPPEALEKAILETNAEVHRRGEANAEFHQMGTTCSTMVLLPQGALVGHIGDSRVYRLRGDLLEQLTFDHSLVWEVRAANQLPPGSELAASLPKNVITRSLGPNADVKVDLEGPFPTQSGDRFLLCSDGLTGPIEDDDLAAVLASMPIKEATRFLIDLANLRGGPDNITLIVTEITAPELTTMHLGARPFASHEPPPKNMSGIALWGVAGALCLLVGGGLALAGLVVPGAIVALVGLGCLGFAAYQFFGDPTSVVGGGGAVAPLGRGPHTRTKVAFHGELLDQLSDYVQKLREAAQEQDWNVAWLDIDTDQKAAASAIEKGDSKAALRHYAKLITYLMKVAREHRSASASDSSIDLV